MAKTTFWDIIEKTIKKVGKPLSAREIWDKAMPIDELRKQIKDKGINK